MVSSRFCSQCVCDLECTATRATATDAVMVHAESLATKDVGPSGSTSSVGIASWVTSGASSRVSLVTKRMLRGKRWS